MRYLSKYWFWAPAFIAALFSIKNRDILYLHVAHVSVSGKLKIHFRNCAIIAQQILQQKKGETGNAGAKVLAGGSQIYLYALAPRPFKVRHDN